VIVSQSSQTLSISYLTRPSYILDINIVLTSRHQFRHQSYVDLPLSQYITHHTTLWRVTHQLALLDLVIVVFVLGVFRVDVSAAIQSPFLSCFWSDL
jgi:hypothetical protein